ncbi:TadE/TadG family type IV pilus assembly protein [Streptomyces sp. DSM 44917]|uniref:TadE/TadG family type IV pilus assembly protein n=1 Tax=Streptomyces boetiae TaxID=3075541 RepID=A0ABU2LFI5_9ACTN|nr:TadE/TadG family type IV pilus assembly protein [Streptomyces sp. DSM 44917]MDT0310353.1 TadE/TadG family type IV pilus assembly protein [Streptomyces sp. DSM 44917]
MAGQRATRRLRRDDRGVTAVEFAGWFPLLIVVALAAIQLGLAGYAALQAGSAARAAARTASQEETEDGWESAGRAAVSDWLTVDFGPVQLCGDEATITASVGVRSVLPFVDNFGEATRTVTMPCD